MSKTIPTPTEAHELHEQSRRPSYLSFTLHAHLPYVVNHGMWPHGLEWLFEAAAETYLPFLRMLSRLERDGISLHCNLDLSPILLEQLAHPVFIAEFPDYLTRKIVAAREDEAYFLQANDQHLAGTARYWQSFYTQALDDFNALDHQIVRGFRHFNDSGLISIITSAATHGFLPLLGTDESVRAQICLAVDTHNRHLGVSPKGVWLPECGYRPAGFWAYPLTDGSPNPIAPAFVRQGLDQALAEAHLNYFFVDSPLVEESRNLPAAPAEAGKRRVSSSRKPINSVYQPYRVESDADPSTTVFARDPRTAVQVWSADVGYPGDFNYLDFHKKRFPGGHRYWKVTGADVDIAHKQPYYPRDAEERVKLHASHFTGIVRETLESSGSTETPPILNALFDAELFGHWWFEGIAWLEAVARELHQQATEPDIPKLSLIDCQHYLELYPPSASIAMRPGSWGAGGLSQVWLNPETSWTYARIYPAELFIREIASRGKWQSCSLGTRITQQLCRELLLLEASDWQFLITTGAARDYAESRFVNHHNEFNEIRAMYQHWEIEGAITPEQLQRLTEIETRDSIFANLDPTLWAARDPVPRDAVALQRS